MYNRQKNFQEWIKRTDALKKGLLGREDILKYYSEVISLNEKEPATLKELNGFSELIEYMQSFSDLNFIPGTGHMNLVYVLAGVQKESGLDLGVCEFLDDKINRYMRMFCLGENQKDLTPQCNTNQNVYIGDLTCCLTPGRLNCVDRVTRLKRKREAQNPENAERKIKMFPLLQF